MRGVMPRRTFSRRRRTAPGDRRQRRQDAEEDRQAAQSGSTLLRSASSQNSSLSSVSFSGCLCGEVVGLREVVGQVVELPDVVARDRTCPGANRARVCGDTSQGMRSSLAQAHQPSLYMARLPNISKYCCVWRSAAVASSKRVEEARAVHRLLLDAVDDLGLGDAGGLEDRRADVDAVRELERTRRLGLDAGAARRRPWVAGAAEMAGDLLAPLERACCRPRPRPRR